MRNLLLILLSAITVLIVSAGGCDANKQKSTLTVKILSYNVRNCRGMDEVVDYQRVADVIRRIDAEVVALQELDSATQRSGGVVVLDELARLTGMYQTFGASIDYQGGKYGIGILTKEKPVSWKRIPLPGREEARSLLIVELKDLVLGCTHFSLNQEDRLASAGIVSSSFSGYDKPVFLAGDLNAVPESEVMKRFESYWNILTNTSVPTIPSDKPSKCIDYILGLKSDGRTFVTNKTVVEDEPVASDHLPVWAEIEVAY
ncbi:MAG TPA: endonuclease/exonuclease/phosphatase family protein [Bacteroidales bacterium]|jgi:endonuclease/exonuclease/phosphatase family metal-dependent hydrolase|nr:endonuclease/exonuclease/phosphatase family protein [Bacteroidales bacterium]HQH22752.1 endonuclease/exonuclease/phosphatase family protein [Bacteroidales bacterium]HQJ83108.1 endonuclease/exonuclease/phosphatase family protein [Bacteroidales bacterium]